MTEQLVLRKRLILQFDDDHKPQTLLVDTPLGMWLAMSQRHGTVRCADDDPAGTDVLIANPDPAPGKPPFVTARFKLKPGHDVRELGRKGSKSRRMIGMCCPVSEWQQERRDGFKKRLERGEITAARFAKAMERMEPNATDLVEAVA